MNNLLNKLKEEDQDFEWYPTTDLMIQIVLSHIHTDAVSIMDIGAGDGRVLTAFSKKCKDAKLYGIEKSLILVQAQPDLIIPVGTDIHEQNLSSLQVDYLYCNPIYSEYEDWVCHIIDQGYAKKAFLIIPQRWQNSEAIKFSLKKRGAKTRVLHHDNFFNAERQARAVVDIVEITFPREKLKFENVEDPFNIWFNANIDMFDKAEEKPEVKEQSLAKRLAHSNIDEMVESYMAEHKLLISNYQAIFKMDGALLMEVGVDKVRVREGFKKKIASLKVEYWQLLFDRLTAITSRLTTKTKKSFIEQLTTQTKVEFTVPNAYAIVIWSIKNANKYIDQQLIDLFFDISQKDNVHSYKSNIRAWENDGWRYTNRERKNTHYVLDYRIVTVLYHGYKKDSSYSWEYPQNVHRNCHELIADIIAVLSNLGYKTDDTNSLLRTTWKGGQWENWYYGENDKMLFQVKVYMNGNLHIRFAQEAIMAINVQTAKLLRWCKTVKDVIEEMDIPVEDAIELFNYNPHLLTSSVKLLNP